MARFRYSVEDFTAQRSMGFILHRAQKLVRQCAERVFERRKLTLSQWIALTLLGEGVVSTPGEIADKLGHDTGATTRLLDQLQNEGFIERYRKDHDRRIVSLSLTQSGRSAIDALLPSVVDTWNDILKEFDREEVETLIGLLTRLIRRLERNDI
jgi:DNA-binding MarR family transcriptional regulator